MQNIFSIISAETGISERQVANTVALLDDGCTIPFISRYRKVRTGGLDETQIELIFKKNEYYNELQARKTTILAAIEKQGKLTPELESEIKNTWNLNDLEDLYLPYKPKRRTRAAVAREKGLEPLAKLIFAQKSVDVYAEAKKYLNDDVKTVEDAIAGASDINAELISEDKSARERVRRMFEQEAVISSKVVKSKMEEAEKYRDYFDFSQRLSTCPSHRILAMRRGESEGFLRVDISPVEEH
ncbi:MAG: RNA-binding transcriptional accessory protein, partial [Bacteroidales bacterium]|nr:RNA-binding transcriptional accessory protein [Bacteroidales bacterium]